LVRRSKLEVFVDIMKVVAQEGEIRRTNLMFKANLAWHVLREALDTMERKGMMTQAKKSSGVFVSLTQEGHDLLRRFSEVESALKPLVGSFETPPTLVTAPSQSFQGERSQ
jgi:predicted transcriptional regulator